MKPYNFSEIEKKWQKRWDEENPFAAADDKPNKTYILDMFPYPSGQGLHVGHPEGYTATDIVSRYRRQKGENVLHPIGWDAFGLPAENYAIKTGNHPKKSTSNNIKTFKRQIKSLGFSYDWNREIDTSSPEYYRWTQWLFLQLYKNDLAYKKKAPVNWCDACQTVLANEQVVGGACERCNGEVIQKELSQWFFKITAYAEELLDVDGLDWSNSLKTTQKNWIGRSEGADISFALSGDESVTVFTTRPDTLYGATFLVMAPEHPLVSKFCENGQVKNKEEVEEYRNSAQQKTELERKEIKKEKTGIALDGVHAINPATKEEIPVWIADYVMMGYGGGAIMAVPAHDTRDFEFAQQYKLPIREVISAPEKTDDIYTEHGMLMNSGKHDGKESKVAARGIVKEVGGKNTIQYKLRDWLISRQRFWGAPIPIIYCDKCGEVPVPEDQLPVELPDDVDFKPTGESPLIHSKIFHDVKCPECGGGARRESDTMDTFVCSSWYFLRFCDSNNEEKPFDKKLVNKWMPVDLYIGGMEHAVGHLLYSRFVTKALRDMKFLSFDEPFLKICNQGLILGKDGEKMSKSRGNVINPDDIVETVGADTLRMYEMFMGPLEDSKPWNTQGVMGIHRFLNRVWKMHEKLSDKDDESTTRMMHKTIKKVTDDIESLHFNTAVSALMICLRHMEETDTSKASFEQFLILLAPFAPFIAEELWEIMGHTKSVTNQTWPDYDERYIVDEAVVIAVQVNGKMRGTLEVDRGAGRDEVLEKIKTDPSLARHYKKPQKVVFVENKIINLIIR